MRFSSLIILLACNTETSKSAVDTGVITNVDSDGDGFAATEDCNDSDPLISPQQEEICDGIDNNCDGNIDEGVLETFYADQDSDTYGDAANPIESCSVPEGYVSNDLDCSDSNAFAWTELGVEICDGQDNDCDGSIDEDLDTLEPNSGGNPFYMGQLNSIPRSFFLSLISALTDSTPLLFGRVSGDGRFSASRVQPFNPALITSVITIMSRSEAALPPTRRHDLGGCFPISF